MSADCTPTGRQFQMGSAAGGASPAPNNLLQAEILEKQFGRDVEAAGEAANVVFVEVALAAENFGDDAGSPKDTGEVLLQEAVLVHQELEDFERLGARNLIVAVFEVLD